MRPSLKIAVAIVAVIVLATGLFVLRTLWLAGSFSTVQPHFDGHCRLIRGPIGPEDVTIHPRTGMAYISASDRRSTAAGKPRPGAIWAYDLNVTGAAPINLTPHAEVDFQPHGISLWVGPDGHEVLFVVNHARTTDGVKHSIQIFDLLNGTLVLRATVSSSLLVMPNDLVAVGADRFYVTNTHKHPPGALQQIETFLRLTGAQVLYYDGSNFRVALDDVVFPNGINISRDGRQLYVASVTTDSVRVYDRDPNERLQLQREVYLGSGPDNIEVDEHGDLWVAAHPQLLKVGAHAKDPRTLSPSQVFRVTAGGVVTEVYANLGEQISASSAGARHGNRLIIGQIFDDGVLDCTMSH